MKQKVVTEKKAESASCTKTSIKKSMEKRGPTAYNVFMKEKCIQFVKKIQLQVCLKLQRLFQRFGKLWRTTTKRFPINLKFERYIHYHLIILLSLVAVHSSIKPYQSKI